MHSKSMGNATTKTYRTNHTLSRQALVDALLRAAIVDPDDRASIHDTVARAVAGQALDLAAEAGSSNAAGNVRSMLYGPFYGSVRRTAKRLAGFRALELRALQLVSEAHCPRPPCYALTYEGVSLTDWPRV